MTFVKNILNDPERKAWVEKRRKRNKGDQIAFYDEVTPFFRSLLDNMPAMPRKVLMAFRRHTALPFKAVVGLSRLPGNEVAVHLCRLKDVGILEKRDDGDWVLTNKDLQYYLIFRASGFVVWVKANPQLDRTDIIGRYIAYRADEDEKNYVFDRYRTRKGRKRMMG